MEKESSLGNIAKETMDFVNLSIDEAKLKITRGLSTALAQIVAYLVILCVLSIVLGLLSNALLQWLDGMIGAPWGTLIVAGVFLVALIVLWCLRKYLFRNMFVKMFIDAFYDTETYE